MQVPKQHILIVDDSEDDAMLLTAELRSILPNTEFQRVENEEEMRGIASARRTRCRCQAL